MTVEAREVTVRFGRRAALTEASLVASEEVVGLIGPNGSGKTTLLRTLYRSLKPDDGDISIDGCRIEDHRPRQLARSVAVVVQEPPGEIGLTVAEMVLLGRSPHRTAWEPYSAEDHRIAAELLTLAGLRERADDLCSSLSGGERQRVLLARALAQGADHLLLDEPTNHLDIRYQHEILTLVRSIPASVVVVLHDLNLAARYCDRLVLLHDGLVVATGTPSSVLDEALIERVYGVAAHRVDGPDGVPQMVFGGRGTAPTDRRLIVGVDDPAAAADVWQRVFGYTPGTPGTGATSVRGPLGDTLVFVPATEGSSLRYIGIDCRLDSVAEPVSTSP